MSDERLKAAAKEVAQKVEELARVTGEILSEKFAELKDQSGPARDRAEQELRDFAAKAEPCIQKAADALREFADKAEEAVGKARSGSKPV